VSACRLTLIAGAELNFRLLRAYSLLALVQADAAYHGVETSFPD